jgi:hypothetical protein
MLPNNNNNNNSGNNNTNNNDNKPPTDNQQAKKKKEAPAPRSVKRRKKKGPAVAVKVPVVYPLSKCKLRLLKLERVKDYLLMEQEFIQNQEIKKPREEQNDSERAKVDDLRGTPMAVGTLEEIIDENHAIVSSAMGPEYYVGIMSFVNQDLLEPGCSVLLHNKVNSVVGILPDDADPMVSVMKVEKAPLESYADIGGLEAQVSNHSFVFHCHSYSSSFLISFLSVFFPFHFRFKRLKKQLNCHSHIPSYMKRLVLNHQKVLFFMVNQVQEKHY